MNNFTSRFRSSSRAKARLFSSSTISSFSIWILAASTRFITSCSISSRRFSSSSSTRFLTSSSIRFEASSSTICKKDDPVANNFLSSLCACWSSSIPYARRLFDASASPFQQDAQPHPVVSCFSGDAFCGHRCCSSTKKKILTNVSYIAKCSKCLVFSILMLYLDFLWLVDRSLRFRCLLLFCRLGDLLRDLPIVCLKIFNQNKLFFWHLYFDKRQKCHFTLLSKLNEKYFGRILQFCSSEHYS